MMFVTDKIKNYGIVLLMLACGVSIFFNAIQRSKIDEYAEKNGALKSQLDTALSSNKSQSETIDKMEAEKLESQKRTDELAQMLQESENREAKTVTEIREIIKYEDCANKPIPSNIDWLYNNSSSN